MMNKQVKLVCEQLHEFLVNVENVFPSNSIYYISSYTTHNSIIGKSGYVEAYFA